MRKLISSALLVLFAYTWAAAESSVWKAQKGNSVLYLGGTCHVLRESDYPLPPEFAKAYKAADVVVFETDLEQMNDLSSQQKLLSKVTYGDGSTIEDHLSPKAYRELSAFCEANGIPLSALQQFKPSMVILTVTVLELMKLGVTQQGVDDFFFRLAKREHKPVAVLESVDEQIEYLATMAQGNEDEFVIHSVQDMRELKQSFEDIAGAWRKGDVKKLDQLMISDLKSKEPKLYRKLLADRNKSWLPVIEGYRKTPKTRFILVGVAHLVGADGLLQSLRKVGYQVDQL